MKTIEIVAYHTAGHEEYRNDFDTKKEARAWVKDAMLSKEYWDRGAEVDGWHTCIERIAMEVDGECEQDWLTGWPVMTAEQLGEHLADDMHAEAMEMVQRLSEPSALPETVYCLAGSKSSPRSHQPRHGRDQVMRCASYSDWLQSLPDHMIDGLAEEGGYAPYLEQQRREELRPVEYPLDFLPE